MTRAEILDKAKECVCGQREQDYGKPEDNFAAIADLWSAYKGTEFSAEDVAVMMALMKIARIKTGTSTDDCFVDLAGYAACGGEIASADKKENGDRNEQFCIHFDTYEERRDTVGEMLRTLAEKGQITVGELRDIAVSKCLRLRLTLHCYDEITDRLGWKDGRAGIKYQDYGYGNYILILSKPTKLDNKEDI